MPVRTYAVRLDQLGERVVEQAPERGFQLPGRQALDRRLRASHRRQQAQRHRIGRQERQQP
ncbi:hypothetical protein [Streptomyces adelaidensis]|uniref:hypothetical protein n=1 Tax=Streptomyces adelaidensis TaxID=2796465 RepID=UPI0027DD9C2C|nr:hypothetical protein [Streptomyces adelaidensis]